jgi:hypothetical protein
MTAPAAKKTAPSIANGRNRFAMTHKSSPRVWRDKAEICALGMNNAAATGQPKPAAPLAATSALPGLETPLCLVDHVNAAFAAHDTIVAVTAAQ